MIEKVQQLEPKHWAIIATVLGGLGAQLAGLEHGWRDAFTPGFIGGLLIQCAATIGGIYVGAPRKPWDKIDRRISNEVNV